MEKLNLTENVNFLWNDVACLNDDNCSFVICKSMVRLPKNQPDIVALEKVEVQEIARQLTRSESGQQEIKGNILMQITYEAEEEEKEKISLIVPFCGEYRGTMERSNTPQVSYVNGQAVGFNNLLLETVMTVPNSSRLLRNDAIMLGEFKEQRTIQLDAQWPGLEQIIGTQVAYQVESYQISPEGILNLAGREQIGILYAGNQPNGEKVMLYRTEQDFSAQMPIQVELAEDAELEAGYFSLTAQIISDREVLIDGNCTVRTSADQLIGSKAPEAETSGERPIAGNQGQQVGNASQAQMVMPQMAHGSPTMKKNGQSGRQRPSKRDNLLKYMRNLDRGMRTPQCTRNIDIASTQEILRSDQEDQNQEDQI